ncbi:MAG: DMT family transporter [Alphaproteobacteria bacterium]|nr:MAG: DMT family transporter [Alphaproteobacteria bacterium]
MRIPYCFSTDVLRTFSQEVRNVYGSIILVVAAGVALISNILIRNLSQCYPPMQILFFKGVVALVLLTIFSFRSLCAVSGAQKWHWHVLRGAIGFIGNYLAVLGLRALPLADATALSLTSAFWGLWGGVVILKEQVSFARILATIVGFGGALFIIKPASLVFNVHTLYPLGAAFCFASSVLIVRYTGKSDGALPSLFGLYSVMTLAPLPWIFCGWTPILRGDIPALLAVGSLSIVSMYGVTTAYILAEASYVAPTKFVRYPLSLFAGIFYCGDTLDVTHTIGALVIVLAIWVLPYADVLKSKKTGFFHRWKNK